MGFDSKIDKVGNVIAKMGRKKPILLLVSHIDTIDDPIDFRQEGNLIFGRGAIDAKGSIAAMIFATKEFLRKPLPFSIVLAFLIEREIPSNRGVNELIKQINPDYIIVGEASGENGIILGYRGRILARILFKNKQVRRASSEEDNFIEEIIEWWLSLDNEIEETCKEEKFFDSISGNIVRMVADGDESTNPEKVELSIDFRVPPQIKANELRSVIESSISNFPFSKSTHKIEFVEIPGSL